MFKHFNISYVPIIKNGSKSNECTVFNNVLNNRVVIFPNKTWVSINPDPYKTLFKHQ